MPKQTKTQSCPACGGLMRFERRAEILEYKGHERRIKLLAWWCTSCEEAILDGKALAESEREFLELKAEVDEVLGPREVAAIRKRLRLSQRKAGDLLGGGPRAFQKYESGKQAVSVPMSNLLRLLANDPGRLRELEDSEAPVKRSPSRTRTRKASDRTAMQGD